MSEGKARTAFSRINSKHKRDPEAFVHHESLKGLSTAGSLCSSQGLNVQGLFLPIRTLETEPNVGGKRLK